MFKRKIGIFLVLVSFCTCLSVNAACDYETQLQISREAANVTANYEIGTYKTGEYEQSEIPNEDGSENYYEVEETEIKVNIYNITENLYVEVLNKNTKEVKTYYYKDTNEGSIQWKNQDFGTIVEYEIKVYSNHSDCSGEELNKLSLVLPKYNSHHYMPYCIGLDTYYCKEWITQEINMTQDEIEKSGYAEQLKNTEKKEDKSETEKDNFWDKYKYVIVSLVVILIIGGMAFIVIKRKQRSDVL